MLSVYLACCCFSVFFEIFLSSSSSAFAADWTFSPSISLRGEYDSNVRFSFRDDEDDFVTSLRSAFTFTGETERTKLRLDPALKFEKYFESSSLDDIHYDINAVLTRMVTDRFSTELSSHLFKDSTLDTQLDEAGVRTQRADRYGFNFGFGENYALTERLSFSARESVRAFIYPDEEFPDMQSLQLEAGPGYQLTPRDTVRLSVTYATRDYDFASGEGGSAEISTLQEMIVWDRQLSETASMSLGAGHRRTWSELSSPVLIFDPGDFTFRTVEEEMESTDDGVVFLALLKNEWSERFATTLFAGREQYSNVDATSFDRTYAGIEGSYRISELAILASKLRYDHNEETGTGRQEIDYVVFTPSLEWKLTERSSLRFAGAYEHENRTGLNFDGDADRFRTWIEFGYSWPAFGEDR